MCLGLQVWMCMCGCVQDRGEDEYVQLSLKDQMGNGEQAVVWRKRE